MIVVYWSSNVNSTTAFIAFLAMLVIPIAVNYIAGRDTDFPRAVPSLRPQPAVRRVPRHAAHLHSAPPSLEPLYFFLLPTLVGILWGTMRFASRWLASRASSEDQRPAPASNLTAVLHRLPIQAFETREELSALRVDALKARLSKYRVNYKDALEKQDLVDAMMHAGGTTATSCSICLQDYASGDWMRVLPCQHRFHVECLDSWFLRQAQAQHPAPQCPVCKANLTPAR